MLLSNIQQNIGKAPMVGAAQSAAHMSEEVSKELRHQEELDRSRKAESQVNAVNKAINGEIDEQLDHEERINENQQGNQKKFGRQKKDKDNNNQNQGDEDGHDSDSPKVSKSSGDHLIDIIA